MKCLIDADILSYEISSCGQFKDELTGETIIRDFDGVAELLDQKIREICEECFSDEPPRLYLTGDEALLKHVNRAAKYEGIEAKVFKPNFRFELATAKPYKGTRKADKPYHFHNLRAYMLSRYDCVVSEGMEADDLLCIDLYSGYKLCRSYGFDLEHMGTIACTRDKDLRMCPGKHYGWTCGKQESFGPKVIDELGELTLSNTTPKKLRGTGLKFFYSQLITGDVVDNIPGLPKRGAVFAYSLLETATSELELYQRVRQAYEDHYADLHPEALREQVDLLWMVRELNEDGSLKFYEYPV